MKKLLLSSVGVLSLTAGANTIYSYEDNSRGGQLFLTNIQQDTRGASKFTQKSVTYYPDTKLHAGGQVPATYEARPQPARQVAAQTKMHTII